MSKLPIALQLYSLREAAADNFIGVLETTAELGYDGVEFAGYGGLTGPALRDTLQQLALTPVSSHVGFDRLVNDFDEIVSYSKPLETRRLFVQPLSRQYVESVEGWRIFAREMTELGKRLAIMGYVSVTTITALSSISLMGAMLLTSFRESDPNYVFAQIDLGWVLHAGVDPVKYLKQFKGRCPLVHVKDFDENKKQVDVGCGCLDLHAVVEAAQAVGVECLIIETEEYAESPIASVRQGLVNLRKALE